MERTPIFIRMTAGTDFEAISMRLDVKISDVKEYRGDYEVVPRAYEDVVLDTKNRYFSENLIVGSIPYQEVSNLSNGMTVTIGG